MTSEERCSLQVFRSILLLARFFRFKLSRTSCAHIHILTPAAISLAQKSSKGCNLLMQEHFVSYVGTSTPILLGPGPPSYLNSYSTQQHNLMYYPRQSYGPPRPPPTHLTSAEIIAWLPPMGNSRLQLGRYHSLTASDVWEAPAYCQC